MAGEKRFTRIPPESTGDRVYMVHTAEIEFNNKGSYDAAIDYDWNIGAQYDIAGFGKVHVHGVFDRGDGTGILAVHYSKTAKFENTEPTVGAKIQFDIDNDNVLENVADVLKAYDVYIPTNNIMGYDNPEYGMDVDITGSANIRFAEGLPQLDAWGKLRTNGATPLGQYVFGQENVLTNNFSPSQLSGGYVTFSDTRKSVSIGINHLDSEFVAADGFAANSSNSYHHYTAGSSHLYAATCRLNNPNATGTTRSWGMFDANNGFFFQVGTGGVNAVDNTGFNVVIRSSIPEAPVKDLKIPRADWNGDKLDGTGDSQAVLDLENANIWWIDIQWHGSGRVRFGTYVDGQRVVCHSYYHGNNYQYAMSQTASLNVCWSIKSTAATNSTLYLETWSASVWTESNLDLRTYGQPATYASSQVAVINAPDEALPENQGWQYLFSLSPEELLSNGDVNHTLYVPTSISAYAFDDTTGYPDGLIDLKMEINSVHSGHSFSLIPSTTVEVSTAGTSYESGKIIIQDMFKGRYQSELTDTFNNFQSGAVKNFSDDGGTQQNTITGITAASTAEITVSGLLNLREPMSVTFPLNTSAYGGKLEIFGSSNTNYNGLFYIKPTGATTAELYTDSALTTPVNSSAFGAFTGTATIKGFRGSRVIWSFFAKTRVTHSTSVKLTLSVNWKEIVQ